MAGARVALSHGPGFSCSDFISAMGVLARESVSIPGAAPRAGYHRLVTGILGVVEAERHRRLRVSFRF